MRGSYCFFSNIFALRFDVFPCSTVIFVVGVFFEVFSAAGFEKTDAGGSM
jgi:hypothetical protein